MERNHATAAALKALVEAALSGDEDLLFEAAEDLQEVGGHSPAEVETFEEAGVLTRDAGFKVGDDVFVTVQVQ